MSVLHAVLDWGQYTVQCADSGTGPVVARQLSMSIGIYASWDSTVTFASVLCLQPQSEQKQKQGAQVPQQTQEQKQEQIA